MTKGPGGNNSSGQQARGGGSKGGAGGSSKGGGSGSSKGGGSCSSKGGGGGSSMSSRAQWDCMKAPGQSGYIERIGPLEIVEKCKMSSNTSGSLKGGGSGSSKGGGSGSSKGGGSKGGGGGGSMSSRAQWDCMKAPGQSGYIERIGPLEIVEKCKMSSNTSGSSKGGGSGSSKGGGGGSSMSSRAQWDCMKAPGQSGYIERIGPLEIVEK